LGNFISDIDCVFASLFALTRCLRAARMSFLILCDRVYQTFTWSAEVFRAFYDCVN
jgi:hypothetical protein